MKMRELKIQGRTGNCRILLGESISSLGGYCKAEKTAIITDGTVRKLHGKSFPASSLVIEIGQGEGEKTLETIERIYSALLESGLDRTSMIIGIGGGMVCDVAGFAASTYLRGIRFAFAPTTLLAQVDASIGGKNGVNYLGYKNMVGVFRQPELVLCDFEVLKTLPPRELSCGFAEVIKHACIGDASLFSYLEEHPDKAMGMNKAAIEKVVYDSLLVKSGIVSKDETEKGERMKLNFGHTIGHAIEKTTGLPHGESVSIGMCMEAKISVMKAGLQGKDAKRIASLLEKFNLPISAKLKKIGILDAISKDKKRHGEEISLVLLEGIGKPKITPVKLSEIEAVLDEL